MSSPAVIDQTRFVVARLSRLWGARERLAARATTTTGSGAIASGLFSALGAKMLATAGPSAIATLVTLQQVRQAAIVAATMNGQTALVQGVSVRLGTDRREYLRTAAILFLTGTSMVAAGLMIFPGLLRCIKGLEILGNSAVRWLTLGVILWSSFIFLTGVLNVLGKIGTLAALQIVASLALVVAISVTLHTHGPVMATPALSAVPLAVLLSMTALITVAACFWPLFKSHAMWRDWVWGEGAIWSNHAARAFLSVSGAMLASGLLASGTVLAIRGRIIEHQGLVATGWFDAAWNISMNHASLLLGSLQTYCLPALTRAKTTREQSAHLTGVLLVAMPAAAAMITGLALTKPWVMELFYAPSFRPATAILRWTLLGDYLKIGSWVVSLPLLARAEMGAFLALDVLAYLTFAAGSVVLSRWLPSGESAAAAFACMYALHLAAGSALVYHRCGIRLERKAMAVWGAGLILVIAISAITWNWL